MMVINEINWEENKKLVIFYISFFLCSGTLDSILTDWGLMKPYDDTDLGQQWFRQWLDAWWHQAIAGTNVD